MPLTAVTAENAKLDYEAGQTPYAMEALTDSGDQQIYTSNASLWSNKKGCAPDVRPAGIITGGVVTPDNAEVNDTVDISGCTCYLAGVETSVNAGELTASRGTAPNVYRITSITITSGGALAAVAGTEGGSFSASRGAAGGPPYIPVDSIELAQIKTTAEASAAIEASEIYQVPNIHREFYDYPLWDEYPLPEEDGSVNGGSIKFHTALMANHTGDEAKYVYAEYNDVVFAELPGVTDFVPPETSHSVSSAQIYAGSGSNTVASRSSSIAGGSFTAYLRSGISDVVAKMKNQILTFRFYPDRYKSQYILCQGKLGLKRSFPPGENVTAACTISPIMSAVDQNS